MPRCCICVCSSTIRSQGLLNTSRPKFTVPSDSQADGGSEDIYYLSRRQFRLNGRRHELVLLRVLTAELRRQEVQTWKKVIRVISHELNNSLAPIASLAHSGAELLRRGQYERLPVALTTIEERARHLEGFIRDYARFAKLPAPRRESVAWARFVAQLRTQVEFACDDKDAIDSKSAALAQVSQKLGEKMYAEQQAKAQAEAQPGPGCSTASRWPLSAPRCPNRSSPPSTNPRSPTPTPRSRACLAPTRMCPGSSAARLPVGLPPSNRPRVCGWNYWATSLPQC